MLGGAESCTVTTSAASLPTAVSAAPESLLESAPLLESGPVEGALLDEEHAAMPRRPRQATAARSAILRSIPEYKPLTSDRRRDPPSARRPRGMRAALDRVHALSVERMDDDERRQRACLLERFESPRPAPTRSSDPLLENVMVAYRGAPTVQLQG
jgi:hypothetical protein